MQSCCHPEPAFFAQREPGLSEADGDLGEPRVSTEPALRERKRPKGAFGSLP
jgi:hypothetical protein